MTRHAKCEVDEGAMELAVPIPRYFEELGV